MDRSRSPIQLRWLLALVVLAGVLPLPLQAVDPGAEPAGAAGASQTWIVQFADPPVAAFDGAAAGYRAHLAERRQVLLGAAAKGGAGIGAPSHVYEFAFNGVAIELDAEAAARLRATPGVVSVTPDFRRYPQTDAGPAWIGADEVWTAPAPLGNRGEGVVIGIIDTGINRAHPSFAAVGPKDGHVHANPKGRFLGLCANGPGCNDKLIGIYDFSDEGAKDGSDVDGHGSHVAATAGGNLLDHSIAVPSGSVPSPVSGVAPHANLVSYKACRADDPATTDDEYGCQVSWLIAAIDHAVADGVDVINYSVGGLDWRGPWYCSSRGCADEQAMLVALEAGVLPVVAAGNDGPAPGSVTSPGDAPWVLSVANATHDRLVLNRVLDLAGGIGPAPGMGTLNGVGQTGSSPRLPMVFPADVPGCAVGSGDGLDANGQPNGSTNPWASNPSNRFNGEIVVCLRGTHARIAKSDNVRREGAGGFILVNTAAEGESLVADAHSLPGVHIGYRDGVELLQWLTSGSGHVGRIEGASVQRLPERADVLSASSGRGPSPVAAWLLPDVTAPGTSIIAAAGSGTGMTVKSGTSMASPHVAGAAALLKSAHPDWLPGDLASALVTTARPSARLEDGNTPASVFDQGAGVVDVGRALRAGLGFRVSGAQYRAANPAIGGKPHELNEPALLDPSCARTCTLRRTVTDLVGGGEWRVVADLPAGASVVATPQQFTLAAGASRQVELRFDVDDPALAGGWVNGRLHFERIGSDGIEDASLPVALFASPGTVPELVPLRSAGDRGHADIALSGLVALPDARFASTAMVDVSIRQRALGQAGDRNDPYADNNNSGRLTTLANVPARDGVPLRLVVDVSSPSSRDVDLYVGEDLDGDGLPSYSEQRCRSISTGANERCVIALKGSAVERSFWILALNYSAGSGGADEVTIEHVVVDMRPSDSGLVVTGPGQVDADDAFRVRASWDVPSLRNGTAKRGYLLLGAQPDRLGDTAQVLVDLRSSNVDAAAPYVMTPGESRILRLPSGGRHDRLIVEVPPNARSLRLETTGAGEIDLYAAHVAAPGNPVIAAAPPHADADAVASTPGARETLLIEGSALKPGRWYVVPVNTGGLSMGQVTATLGYGAARAMPRFGAWYNPARGGAGVFLYQVGDNWALFWYTFLQDGTPTWYLGSAPAPGPQQGSWTVPLFRYSWNGASQHGTQVGEAVLAFEAADRFTFGWNLDGQSGSEPHAFIGTGACPQGSIRDLTGSWNQPELSGYGYSINAGAALETNAAYFYDGQGVARWAFGSSAPFGSDSIELLQYQGACPLCDYARPTTTPVGAFVRSFSSKQAGTAALDVSLAPPLKGTWSTSGSLRKLTSDIGCD